MTRTYNRNLQMHYTTLQNSTLGPILHKHITYYGCITEQQKFKLELFSIFSIEKSSLVQSLFTTVIEVICIFSWVVNLSLQEMHSLLLLIELEDSRDSITLVLLLHSGQFIIPQTLNVVFESIIYTKCSVLQAPIEQNFSEMEASLNLVVL